MFKASPAGVFLPCFLQVVASVDVHLLDHGPMWDLQGDDTPVILPVTFKLLLLLLGDIFF